MNGIIRRTITHLILTVLLCLELLNNPEEDKILQDSLLVDMFQINSSGLTGP